MVSVIIPTYNRSSTIKKAILSVINQTYKDLEIIVVDDASDDDTQRVVEAIQDCRIKYVRNAQNRGVAGSRNIGICNAKGEFIAFNDSDDLWMPNKLERQMRIMDQNPECQLIYCAFRRTNLDGSIERIPAIEEKMENLQGNIFYDLLQRNTISTQTMLFRRECFDKVGLFKEELRALDDYEMALRVAYSNDILYINEELVDVFLSEDSISRLEKNYLEHFKAYVHFLKTYWNKVDDNKKLDCFVLDAEWCVMMMNTHELDMYVSEMTPYLLQEKDYLYILKNLRRYKYKNDVMEDLYNISLDKWKGYFEKAGISKIAIYGNGYIGRTIREKSTTIGLDVLYVIDRKKKENDSAIISLDEIEKFAYPEMIIISVFDETDKVKNKINNKIKTKIYHIDEILVEINK